MIHAVQSALQIPSTDMAWIAPLFTVGLCILTIGVMVFVGGLFIGTGNRRKPVHEKAEAA